MKPLDPRLLRHARATRGFLILCVALGSVSAALVIAQATVLSDVVVNAFLGGATLSVVLGSVGVLALVVAGRAIVAWAAEAAAERASAAVRSELRRKLLAQVVALAGRRLAAERSGELATLATKGVDALQPYFARYLPQLVLAVVVPATVGLRILIGDWLAAVIIAATLPLVPLFMVLVGLHTKVTTARSWRALAVLGHHFLDVVAGLPTLKAYGRAAAQLDTIRNITDRHRAATMKALRVAFLSAFVLELISTLSVALVAVSIGLRLVEGTMDLRTGLLVLILAPEVYLPLRAVGAQFHASADGVAAAERIFELLDDDEPAPERRTRPVRIPDLSRATIRLDEATVTGRQAPALDRCSLVLPPGTVIGLVGPSGAGKSTVISLLLRFATPDTGRVVITDGDTGEAIDLADLDPALWRRQVAWLPQRPTLLAGTVAANIRLGRPTADDEDVAAAARAARLDVPLSTAVEEAGGGLSTGQQRRVALARALLVDRPVLLLDEPTEGVDAATETALIDALRVAVRGRTVLLVSHRPAVLELCDEVVTLRPALAAR